MRLRGKKGREAIEGHSGCLAARRGALPLLCASSATPQAMPGNCLQSMPPAISKFATAVVTNVCKETQVARPVCCYFQVLGRPRSPHHEPGGRSVQTGRPLSGPACASTARVHSRSVSRRLSQQIFVWLHSKLASPPLPSNSVSKRCPCVTAWTGFVLISAPPLP